MVGVDGYEVEAINLGGRQRLRVSRLVGGRRYFIACCRTPAEVAAHVDLADLVEVTDFSAYRRL
ncbi:transposase [Planotetraspora kaengkrachanensis]|uniref:Transposase n=1 Tax=Planotetraspora kaengkrachanensis TaxID=575193 RepID=A0A8J3PUR6_9ACTN|nr:transposase [Planotetraspora kaengkrachanensis]GIG81428.1 hypothetical protein Pka01_45550 [Planotetraspora kaengkrachanensis]